MFVSGNVFKACGCTVFSESEKQQTVGISSSEAEYVAFSLATIEVIWIRGITQVLQEICENY